MLQFLLLVATSALGCDPQYAEDQSTYIASYSIKPESWSSPSTEGMKCIRGYSNCWAPGTRQDGCTNEYSFIDPDVCTRYSVSFVGPENKSSSSATGVVIDNHSTVREDDKNFDEALWNNVLTPTSGCAVEYRAIACDQTTSNCSAKDVSADRPLSSKTPAETQDDCHGYFINALVFDSNHGTPNFSAKENGEISNRRIMSSMTVAWTTTVSKKPCIAAYNLCWRKKTISYVGCRRTLGTYKSVTRSGPVPNLRHALSVDVLLRDVIKTDEVTSASRSGTARLPWNFFIAVLTIIGLLRLSTTPQM